MVTMEKSDHSRRGFIKKSAMASSAIMLPTESLFNKISTIFSENNTPQIFLFSKQLQFLNYTDMCEATKEIGFSGLDLTVRPKGHVLPERVTDDLPRATEAMKIFSLKPQLITTNVNDYQNINDISVLKTASELGYQYYRPAWYKYSDETKILETIENAKIQLKNLDKLNNAFNINLAYQNHSGHYFGSSIWDLQQVLQEIKPKKSGCQYDIMHATVEGGKNWEIGFHIIKPYINSIVIKDFKWKKINNKWTVKYVPLGEGMVNFDRFFSLLKKHSINVPICLHAEYDLGGAEHGNIPIISNKEVFKKLKHDLIFIKKNWAKTS
jgi:sugar phosphate isomerase/epimerase